MLGLSKRIKSKMESVPLLGGGGQIKNDIIFSVIFIQYLYLFLLFLLNYCFGSISINIGNMGSFNNLLMSGTYLD